MRLIDRLPVTPPCRRYRRGKAIGGRESGKAKDVYSFFLHTSKQQQQQQSKLFYTLFFFHPYCCTPTHLAASLEVRGAVDIPLPEVNPVEVLLLHRSAAAAALNSKLGSRDFYCVGCRTSAAAPRLVPRTPGGMLASTVVRVRTPCDSVEEASCYRRRGRQVLLGLSLMRLLQ